tara:strand:- start:734 stop:1060 length:327 start_codon:yes stop_codon:yes gene_type:complete
MPRGEHFKKENPRINQVSFKVSDSELVQLKDIAKGEGISVATWLREQIIKQKNSPEAATSIQSAPTLINETPIVGPSTKETAVVEKKEVKKAKNYDKQEVINEQMSMF